MIFTRLELPETGVHLYEYKHQRGDNISLHYHNNFQILYVLDGDGRITLDGECYEFSRDRTALIIPNSPHSIQADLKLTVLVLAFSAHLLEPNITEELLKVCQNRSQYFQLDLFRASEIKQLLRKMLFEQSNYDSLCKLSLPVYLLEALLMYIRLKTEKNFDSANDVRCLQMREYIDKHYFENITAESLSLKFGISHRYLNNIFKGKFNETPLQYLQKVRIDRSKELLIETDKEIAYICFEVGYETLSTFYRSFRNVVGMSPNKFRNTNQYFKKVKNVMA
ncbi:AraC family transcriptional regulator [Pueribacillus theae]|uniref:AraC family transcriptional regulator n=1 Tax=Pueribacillus theae TaxID=2171751 RepID=A0A2U1K2S0_9BACI|nr:AraC family transcriptional regulator [Pueribacillus theae]PWA11820.1 AraC family transcriptional regulator [Pueribacillus theae]